MGTIADRTKSTRGRTYRRGSGTQRAAATLMVALATLIIFPAAGHAAVHRSFEPRFSVSAEGDIHIVGNTLSTCSTEKHPNRDFCDDARAGGDGRNNQFFMERVDVDANDYTFNSSAASFELRPNAEVLWAGLYWGARLTAGKYSGSDAPNPALADRVLFGTDQSGYDELKADQIDRFGSTYSAFADVTSIVRQQESGSTTPYWMGNVQAATGGNRHAGWALVIAYRDPAESLRNLTVFDGYADVRPRSSWTETIRGFATPLNGDFDIRLGAVTFDGDINLRGDGLKINDSEIGSLASDTDRPNLFDAGISRLGERISAKQPDFVNQFGVDIDIVSASGVIANSAEDAEITFTTRGDIYYPAVLTYAAEVFHPAMADQFTQTVTDVNGGDTLPGETLRVDIAFSNTGLDPASELVLTVPMPAGVTYIPDSLQIARDDASPDNAGPQSDTPNDDLAEFLGDRIVFRPGKGASSTGGGRLDAANPSEGDTEREVVAVSFDVRIGDRVVEYPLQIKSQAKLNYRSLSTRAALISRSNATTVSVLEPPRAAIGVASEVSDPGPVDNLDGSHTFTETIVVENSGVTELTGVSLQRDLAETFGDAQIEMGPVTIASGEQYLIANDDYTGVSPHTNLLDAKSALPAGAKATLAVVTTVTPPSGEVGPYRSSIRAAGSTFFDLTYADVSTAGAAPDADGDGDPGDDGEPTIISFNSPPIAVADRATAEYGASATINVLENDSDPDAETLTVVAFENDNDPEFGTLRDLGDGVFAYDAPLIEPTNFSGDYSFDYTIEDPAGQRTSASATLHVPMAETDLEVKVAGDRKPVALGEQLEISVTARNRGAQAADPLVSTQLGSGLRLESATPSQGTYDSVTGEWAPGTMGAAAARQPTEATLTLTATVIAPDDNFAEAAIAAENISDRKARNDASRFSAKVVAPEIAITRARIGDPIENVDGSFDIRYAITVKNTGRVGLSGLEIYTGLADDFADAEAFFVNELSGDFDTNPDYDGGRNTNLLTGTNILAPGRSGKLQIEVRVVPGVEIGPYAGGIVVAAQSAQKIPVRADADFRRDHA